MKDKGYDTSGSLLERAAYELMEREGWDVETQQFIDFDEDDNDSFSPRPKHTHINKKSIEESVKIKVKRKPESEEKLLKSPQKIQEAITASSRNRITNRLPMILNVEKPSNEELYTYAFCKVFEKMPTVHYEQIEQLSIPFFKSKDERAIKNKPNILIHNQCIVKTNKHNYKVLPTGIQRYITENSHLEEILKEKVNKDFLDAMKP